MAVHQLPRALTLATVALLGVAACSKSSGSPSNVSLGPKVSTTAVVTVKPTIGGPIGQATAGECASQRDTMEQALIAYEALNGKPAATEADLVSSGVVHEQSVFYDVQDGHLVLARNSPCPVP